MNGHEGTAAVYGLSVRWSLEQATEGAPDRLREYVVGTSLARFATLDGLRFKTWRVRPGEWFEGTYVFATAATRDDFQTTFASTAAQSPGSRLVGSPPIAIETFDVVAVAEGPAGFASGPGPT